MQELVRHEVEVGTGDKNTTILVRHLNKISQMSSEHRKVENY
jgi:hypothetical protein